MTGASKVASSSAMTWGGREEDDERMKRSLALATMGPLRAERPRIA